MARPPQRQRIFMISGAPGTLGSLVAGLTPSDVSAISEGRVFVGKKRVDRADFMVAPGSRIVCYARRSAPPSDPRAEVPIVARRNDWVIANKPAAFTCEPDRTGSALSLRAAVERQLGIRGIHVVTRLDVGVSGLVLISIGKHANRITSTLQNQHRVAKDYLALVYGCPKAQVTWTQPLRDGRPAVTHAHVLDAVQNIRWSQGEPAPAALLQVQPITGRKHQIRCHASTQGYPLLGDRRYGGPAHAVAPTGAVLRFDRIMLHAYRLTIPLESGAWVTSLEPSADMVDAWRTLGGDVSQLKL